MDKIRNAAYSTVATPPSPATSGTTMALATGEGARMVARSGGVPFNLTVWPASVGGVNAPPLWAAGTAANGNFEIVRVTAISGDSVTAMTRAQGGTTARTIVAGDQVAQVIDEDLLTQIVRYSGQELGMALTCEPAIPNANVSSGNETFYSRVTRGCQGITKIGVLIQGVGAIDVGHYSNTGAGSSARPDARLAQSSGGSVSAAGYKEISVGSTIDVPLGNWLAISSPNGATTAIWTNELGTGGVVMLDFVSMHETGVMLPATASPSSYAHPVPIYGSI